VIPRDPAPDASVAFLREGFEFVGNRCRRLGADAFATRLFLRPVVCMRGAEAARTFYERRLTRRGAMPVTALTLLQDRGSWRRSTARPTAGASSSSCAWRDPTPSTG
jgi:fatty-acid peroxygenase